MAANYLRKYDTPPASTETTLYTVPAATTIVLSSLRITNENASTANISVAVYPLGGATPYYILRLYVLPTNQTMDAFGGVPCVLEAGDVLKVTASQSSVDFYLSYMQLDRT